MPNIHIVHSGYLAPALNRLREDGIDVKDLLVRTGLNRYILDDPCSYVPAKLISQLYELVQKEHLVYVPEFFNEAIKLLSRAERNQDIESQAYLLRRKEGTETLFFIKMDKESGLANELAVHAVMLFILNAVQSGKGKTREPIKIYYQSRKPAPQGMYPDMGKIIPVQYGMPLSGFKFKTIDLHTLKESLNRDYPVSDLTFGLSRSIEQMLDSFEITRIPNIDYFSELAGMSSRNLIRKLKDEGRTFFQIVDSWRFDRAVKYLEDDAVKITHLGDKLGYANHSNFERAFKRWTGMTPTSYRESRFN